MSRRNLVVAVLALAAALALPSCSRREAAQNAPPQNSPQSSAQNSSQNAPPSAPAPAVQEPPPAAAAPAETAPQRPAPARETPAPEPPRSTPRPRPAPAPARDVTGGTGAAEERSAPAPSTAPPAPAEVTRTVAAGTVVPIRFLDGVSSRGSQAGDTFRATVTSDIAQDGVTLIPAGATVVGTVTEAVPLKKIGGQAHLGLEFSRIELPSGHTAVIHASFAQLGKSETGRDAATIGGAAAGGAILGRVLSRNQANRNTVIGALLGAGVGTAIAAKSKGQEVEVPAGTELQLKLDEPAQVTIVRRR